MNDHRSNSAVPSKPEYFTGLAQNYAEHRPTYPRSAIAWMLDGFASPIRAADIGCGTGISSRLLAGSGAAVIGIDPNQDMLEQARRASSSAASAPAIEYRIGSGEKTGLHEGSVDLVLCAQAFHWLDRFAALREFHRIIRAGGRLALMWNVRDDRDELTAQYSGLAHQAQADAAQRGLEVHEMRSADPAVGGFFKETRRKDFPNPQQLDLEGLLGRARSASYFPRSGQLREDLETAMHRLFEKYQRHGTVVLAHRTEVTLADRVNS